MSFVHLHVHTEYSLLDGAIRIKKLAQKMKDLGMNSIAITDHGVMYGAVEFYKALVKEGIKPIIGCEVYVSPKGRFVKEGRSENSQAHLVLLAKNETGYKNLIKLVSIGFVEGFYYKPRIDMEVIKEHSEGLIALSACLGGEIPGLIMAHRYEEAKAMALQYNDVFGGGNFYLELQDHGIAQQREVNQKLVEISKETGIPLVATNDAHYMDKEDAKAHEVLLCMQTGKTMNDEDRMVFESDQFYLKSEDEMNRLFAYAPEAIENTQKIADQCCFNFDFNNYHLPTFDVPGGMEPFEYLKKRCEEGFEMRYGDNPDKANIKERLEYELNVINTMGYVDYFLIVQDFIMFAKQHGIMVGPGRGSAAGSVVSYTLEITNIDPIKYNLVFERFLNPERVSMPDIDIDFCYVRRPEVIDYVVRKYGADKVAQIVTFGTLAARAAIKDTGRALGMPYAQVDKIAKMIPSQLGISIEKALDINKELKQNYQTDDEIKVLIDTAMSVEGMPRHTSTHAAGVVITGKPVTDYVPVQKVDTGITTQYTMTLLEELGLLKMDFLGLRTLTVIQDACGFIKKNKGIEIDIDKIDMDDKNVYKMIGKGKTCGVFQFESAGMTQFMKELQPNALEDIIAGVSLYRPGPMDQIPTYIKNKNNPDLVTYAHPLMEKILNVTYGCMVYQEQVMQIVRDLAGYSMGRSDLVRRAMSKKKANVMQEERKNFIYGIVDEAGKVLVDGALRRGVSESVANKIFDQMMDFASYAFNKSHAAAYAVVAYQTAWLKYYYPVEFMASMLNSFLSSADKIAQYILEAKNLNISILPPDINESTKGFMVFGNSIRFGLAAIKNIGDSAISGIIKEREIGGPYKSILDFCERNAGHEVNKKCVESLIRSGALDCFEGNRAQKMAVYEKMMDVASSQLKTSMEGQFSLFDLGIEDNTTLKIELPKLKEFPKNVLLEMEKEMLGLYISGNPLDEYKDILLSKPYSSSLDINQFLQEEEEKGFNQGDTTDGMELVIGGVVSERKNKVTRNGGIMAFITVDDLYGPIEALAFPKVLEKFGNELEKGNYVCLKGKLSVKTDEVKFLIGNVKILSKHIRKKLYLRLPKGSNIDYNSKVKSILKEECGSVPVYVCYFGDRSADLLDKEFWIEGSEHCLKELIDLLGVDNVKIKD